MLFKWLTLTFNLLLQTKLSFTYAHLVKSEVFIFTSGILCLSAVGDLKIHANKKPSRVSGTSLKLISNFLAVSMSDLQKIAALADSSQPIYEFRFKTYISSRTVRGTLGKTSLESYGSRHQCRATQLYILATRSKISPRPSHRLTMTEIRNRMVCLVSHGAWTYLANPIHLLNSEN